MSKCKSCGAEIIWIKTASGKAMPCDAAPISFDLVLPGTKGALTLIEQDGRVAFGKFNPGGDHIGYISHFATCPAAAEYRRKT